MDNSIEEITLFLAADGSGAMKWYTKDPIEGGEGFETIEQFLVSRHGGVSSILEPLRVRMTVERERLAEPFNIRTVLEIARGQFSKAVVDGEGHRVQIMLSGGDRGQYRFAGVVTDWDGNPIGGRSYSGLGVCSDGVPEHNLCVIDCPEH